MSSRALLVILFTAAFGASSARAGAAPDVLAVTLDQAKSVAKRLWGEGLLTVVVGRQPQAAAEPAGATPPPPKAN